MINAVLQGGAVVFSAIIGGALLGAILLAVRKYVFPALLTLLRNFVTFVRHPIRTLDLWWLNHSKERRLDRGPANMCMLIGLMLPSMSIVLLGPTPTSALNEMPADLQMAMCLCIFTGCIMKMHGALSRSRFWFPRKPVKHCYQIGYRGAPIATSGLFVYSYFLLNITPNWLSALAVVLTPMLGLGIGLQAGTYWLEVRRIERDELALIRQAKQAQ